MSLFKLAIASAAGFAFYKYAMRQKSGRAAFASGEGADDNFAQVRNAGPDAMRDKPETWSDVDEESDESFPASDPPANY